MNFRYKKYHDNWWCNEMNQIQKDNAKEKFDLKFRYKTCNDRLQIINVAEFYDDLGRVWFYEIAGVRANEQ